MVKFTFVIILLAFVKTLSSSISNANKTLYSISIRGFNIINNNQATIVKDSFLSIITNLNNEISFTGKICYVERLEDFTESCVKAYRKLIKHWIIQVKDINTFKMINSYMKDYRKNKGSQFTDIKTFFFSESVLNPSTVNNIDNISIPILIFSDSSFFEILNKFTVTNEKDDVFLKISFFRLIDAKQKQAAIAITIVKILLFVGMNFAWFILKKKVILEENDITYIQAIIDNVMFFILIKELFTIYYLIRTPPSTDDINRDAYLEILINAIDTIIRSLTCLLFISVAQGYGVFRSKLVGAEIKRLLGLFVAIYLLIFVDQVLSSPLGYLIYYGIEVKDIKNIILITILLFFVLYYGIRAILLLSRKINDLLVFNNEYLIADINGSITTLKNKRLVLM